MSKLYLITFILLSSLFAKERYSNVYEAMMNAPEKVTEMSNLMQQSYSVAANGNLAESMRYTVKAQKLGNEIFGENSDALIQINFNLGIAYYTIGDSSMALQYYLNMIKYNQNVLSASNPLNRPAVYGTVATIYSRMGNYSKSIEYNLIALNDLKKAYLPDNMKYMLGNQYRNLANDYFNSNNFTNAIMYKKESIASYPEKSPLLTKSYLELSKFYKKMNETENEKLYKEKALEIAIKIYSDENVTKNVSADALGDVLFEDQRYEDALKYYFEALEYRKKIINNELKIYYTYNYSKIAITYQKLEKHKEAIEWFNKTNELLNEVRGSNISERDYDYAYTLSKEYYALHDLNNSYFQANKSIKSLQKLFENSFQNTSDEQKENSYNELLIVINNFINISQKFYEFTLKKEVASDIFSNWINQKGVLNEFDNLIYTLKKHERDKEVSQKIEDFILYKRALSKHLQTPPVSKNDIETYNAKTKELEQNISDLEQQLALKVEKFKISMGLKNIQLKDISSNLSSDTLYVDYAMTDEAYYAFTLDHNENVNFIKVADRNTIDKAVSDFRVDIDYVIKEKNGVLAQEEEKKLNLATQVKLAKLYDLLLKPLELNMKQKTKLLISLDGALNLIPFEALYSDHNYLVSSKEIVYTPSAKEFVRVNKLSKYNNKKDTVVFANPNYDAKNQDNNNTDDTTNLRSFQVLKALSKMSFEPLSGSKKEAENIKKVSKKMNVQILEKDESSEENLLKVQSPKILHLSTHGFFIDDDHISNPLLLSGIALAAANTSLIFGKDEGIVTALKLSGMDLSTTDLVVLSACDTGRGVIKAGNGVAGLNKAFISAGAKNILMSLWSVSDKETVELMTNFYSLNQDESYAKALRDTKIEMIKGNRHPFYWSAFILSGKE